MGRKQKINTILPLELPCRKKMYNSREEADDMIKYIRENRTGHQIRAYKCDICGFWHLTSRITKGLQ